MVDDRVDLVGMIDGTTSSHLLSLHFPLLCLVRLLLPQTEAS